MCEVHVSNQAAEVFLKDGSLNDGPDDEAFLQSLRRSLKTALGAYKNTKTRQQDKQQHKTNKDKSRQVLECETRGEKR